MVWKIRRITLCFLTVLLLITATCGSVKAFTHNVYENGNLGTTYVSYFKDVLSGTSFKDNYVAFRSGQYSYSLIVGELKNENGVISLLSPGKEYKFYTENSGYNSQYYYDVLDINDFSLNVGNSILYSDVGDFPELIERGAKYETLNTILIVIIMLSFVISRIFYKR